MRVVVTGACGFIGKRFTKLLLSKGFEVYAVVTNEKRLNSINNNNKLHVIKAYFDDYEKLLDIIPKDVNLFYHFAWQGVFGDAFKDYEMQLNNVKYACHSLLIAKKLKTKKFIFASTANVLELKKNMDLDYFEARYTNIYSTAKLSADMMLKTLAYNNNIEYNCGMISMVYGEENYSKMIPNIVMSNLLYNRESKLIDEDTEYDLIYVEDVCNAFYHIGIEGHNMKTYYVGHNNTKKFKSIFDEIRDILNPHGVLRYGEYNVTNNMDYTRTDMNALSKDTKFKIESNFKDTIIKTAQWIKESGEFE